MGFLEKLKNTFFEEEYVEIEEKPKVHKEPKKEVRPVETKKEEPTRVVIRKEEVKEVIPEKRKTVVQEAVKEKEPRESKQVEQVSVKETRNFGYFDDSDFLDFPEEEYVPPRPKVVLKKEVEPEKVQPKLYDNPTYASKTTTAPTKTGPYSKQVKSGFQPTPIISPIYGILDKNYTKEEIADKKETKPSSYVSRKNADLDSVRAKAFGSLTEDFDLTTSEKNVTPVVEEPLEDDYEIEDNLLYDMTNDCKTPAVDKVTLQDAEEYFQDLGLEYNIDYKDAKLERATGRRVSKTPKIDEIDKEEIQEEKPVLKVSNKPRKEENSSLEDNLFDLIDSMYEEKE